MNFTIENFLLVGSILLIISIIAGKTSHRFGVPILLFFLAVGMLAGSEGIGGIYFDDPHVANFIGIISLNFILFSGGLDTRWDAIRPVVWQGVSLSTIGVLVTAVVVGVSVPYFTPLSWREGLLLGAIISSTDAPAVFTILRSKGVGLRGNLRPLLELESGSNDPMAYLLTTVALQLVTTVDGSLGYWALAGLFVQQMAIGALAGWAEATDGAGAAKLRCLPEGEPHTIRIGGWGFVQQVIEVPQPSLEAAPTAIVVRVCRKG